MNPKFFSQNVYFKWHLQLYSFLFNKKIKNNQNNNNNNDDLCRKDSRWKTKFKCDEHFKATKYKIEGYCVDLVLCS